jgi:probable F420-dependent oxidoreductase
MQPRPFRFGVQLSSLPAQNWIETVRQIETMGFSTLFVPDHFSASAWDPTTMLGGVAAVTTTLKVGTLVYGIDYRHPVVYARQAATLQLMSGGRHEFGLGAGWMRDDYDWAGIRYDAASQRIARLEEALIIIKSMWRAKKTTFTGTHYQVSDVPLKIALPDGTPPPVLVGGGGEKLLGVAGRHADIVGINPKIPAGRITPATTLDATREKTLQKIAWLRDAALAAGRDPDTIELNALIYVANVTDTPGPVREVVAASTGMPAELVTDSPLFLVGSGAEICDTLQRRRAETGMSYIVIQGHDADQLARFAQEVVRPLSGE